jgi:hypothetical protein
MTTLKTGVWPWLIVGVVLILVGVVALDGGAGDIVLACGFIALFGAGIRLISRNDSTPPEERRVPAGHSGV